VELLPKWKGTVDGLCHENRTGIGALEQGEKIVGGVRIMRSERKTDWWICTTHPFWR